MCSLNDSGIEPEHRQDRDLVDHGLASLITLGLGYFFFYVVWQRYVVDVTRQQLFELRDQLFDLAAEGKLSYQSEVYRSLRSFFNASIRFAHQADWVHIVVFYVAAKLKAKDAIFKSAMHIPHLVNRIEEDKTRAEVQAIITKMHLTMGWHFLRRSLVLLPLVLVVVVVAAFFTLSIRLFTRTPRKFEALLNAWTVSAL